MFEIRKSTPNDAEQIAELMLFAMKGIVYEFIGEENYDKAKQFLKELIEQTNNQYSFENTYVALENSNIVGSFTLYEGDKLKDFRKPVIEKIKTEFDLIILPEDETEAGEIYIDTIAVYPEYRGKGFGNKILDYITKEIAERENVTVGLLVDFKNPKALKLYESKGFKKVGEKTLMNTRNYHLQYRKGA